jgi:outer membrane protein assembly factor BamB
MRNIALTVFVCVALSILATTTYGQESWTRFRGENGEGKAPDAVFPASWTTADYKWRVLLPGEGGSSPIVDGDQVFVTCGLEDGTRLLRCLDTQDGGLIWKQSFEASATQTHSTNTYAPSTPTIDKERVYTTWGSGEEYVVVALTRDRGEEVWRKNIGSFEGEHGFGVSPILCEGLLIVTNQNDADSFVLALDPATGDEVWRTPRGNDSACYGTPCLYQPEGESPQLIGANWADGAYGLDPTDGHVLWQGPPRSYRLVASPFVAAENVFLCGGTGGVGREMHAIRIGTEANEWDHGIAYPIEGTVPYVPTGIELGEDVLLWTDKGTVRRLNAATGETLDELRIGGVYYTSPILCGDRLYSISLRGEMRIVVIEPQLEEVGNVDLEEGSSATPAVANGVMYIRTESHLMALEAEK